MSIELGYQLALYTSIEIIHQKYEKKRNDFNVGDCNRLVFSKTDFKPINIDLK